MQPSAIRAMTKLAVAAGRDLITFAGGMPNPATFPLERLAEIAAEEIRNHHGRSLQYGMTTGFRPLIDWICSYMQNKHVVASPETTMCTTGSQQAIDLIVEVLLDSEDYIFVETPTYIGALAVFQKSGAQMKAVRQDAQGIVLEDLREKLASVPLEAKKLIYLISNFQNPSGVSLAAERRRQIVPLLDEFNAYLIEDDPYGEIYFGESSRPPDPIQAQASPRVLYLGTFSKLVAPTFRTGWVVAEQRILYRIELAKEAADLCGSMLDQRVVCRFCSSPEFPAHLDRLRSFYAVRCQAMEQALARYMPAGVSWTHPQGGFFVWLRLPESIDAESLLEETILRQKVAYVIGRPFTCDQSAGNYMRLAFSVEEPDRIDEGIRRLAQVIKNNVT